MVKVDLKTLKKQAEKEIGLVENLNDLKDVFGKYLGKKGEIVSVLRSLKDVSSIERGKIGKEANDLKKSLEAEFKSKAGELKEKLQKEFEKKEWIDVTVPGKKINVGHLHPMTLVRRRAAEIFESMGFSIIEGPEIENEWYNFDALNIPKDHPARDAWDTFWLKSKEEKLLLRTHTSPVQARYMEKNSPPLRIIVPGRVFRYEATDASHDFDFWQLEGLMVEKNISAANFKAIIQEFYRKFFGKPVKVRFVPSFFPFTEPSFQVDMSCVNCGGKGCSSCQQSGWLEMMGAGIVNPNVYKYCGLNPKNLTGFAFGMGLERLVMMKAKINDIRLFHSEDLRFLNQF